LPEIKYQLKGCYFISSGMMPFVETKVSSINIPGVYFLILGVEILIKMLREWMQAIKITGIGIKIPVL